MSASANPSRPESPAQSLLRMANAFHTSQAIHVAAQLGLADLLAEGPQDSAALAAATGTHAPSLYRMLRLLVSLGVFSQNADGRFALTELGAALRASANPSLRDAILFLTSEWLWRAWGALGHSVRTGDAAFDQVWGMSNFDFWEHDAEAGVIHDQGMTALTSLQLPAIIAAYDYSPFKLIVDVGGGQGALLAAILQTQPHARGILFDLPLVVNLAGDFLAAAGVADRCSVVGGSFFESVPRGADAYLLKYVLHDWDDEQSLKILQVVRRAMAPHSTLLTIEQVLPSTIEPSPEVFNMFRLDLQMLVLTPGGRERTAEEFGALFAAAGFEIKAIHRTRSVMSIIECAAV